MNIYVGNLLPGTSESKLRRAFEMYGKVGKITINEHSPGQDAYGFCFVEMPFDNQASRAIKQLNGTMLNGCSLTVKESGVSV